MNGAIMVRWGQGIPGREAEGIDVFGKAVARFEEYAKEGRVHGHREFVAVTGPDGGFMIVDGELEELMKILGEDETLRLNAQAAAIVSDFEIQAYAGGDDGTMQQLMNTYAEGMRELGYM
jgi:hypothetical protein